MIVLLHKLCTTSTLRYSIEDLSAARQYLANANLKICLEAGGPCEIDVDILDNVLLPQLPCDMNTGFEIQSKYFI